MGLKQAINNAKTTNQSQTPESSQSQAKGQQASQNLSGQLDSITDKMADNIVDMIAAKALQKAFTRLGSGDLGTIVPGMISNFEQGLLSPFESSIAELEAWESPKALPPSPAELPE